MKFECLWGLSVIMNFFLGLALSYLKEQFSRKKKLDIILLLYIQQM